MKPSALAARLAPGSVPRWVTVCRSVGSAMTATVLLSACASTPPAAVPGDRLSGRLLVRVADTPPRSLSADFELTGSARQGQLVLDGPLGTTAARARWAPGEAVLITAGGEVLAADLDALAVRALGEAIPMAALFDWLRGRAWPGAASTPRTDGVPGFDQLGWQVDLARQAEGWIEARRVSAPEVLVRVRLTPG